MGQEQQMTDHQHDISLNLWEDEENADVVRMGSGIFTNMSFQYNN